MNTRTALIGAALVVVAVVGLIVLSSGSDDDSSGTATEAGTVPTVVVNQQGEPVGGVQELVYRKGDQIHFKVKVPFEEEVHLHGYDVMKEAPQGGGTVTYDLPADIEGLFEAELEGKGEQIVELKVEP